MAKEYLRPVFFDVYEKNFDQSSFDDRMEMQKMVFLLQEAGVSIGDYNFVWYKHGPYCQDLQNDILDIGHVKDVKVNYSSDAKEVIDRLKCVIEKKNVYKKPAWVECLASLEYLKAYILPLNSDDDAILNELVARKSHLNRQSVNREALMSLAEIIG